MPYARKTRPRTYRRRSYFSRYRKGSRYYKKRMYSKRRYSRKAITSLGQAIPRTIYQKLTYADIFDLTVGAVTAHGERFFRPTDLNDVDYTGAGGYPTPFTTMASMWKKWQVKGYKYSMHFINTCNQNLIVGTVDNGEDFIYPTDGTKAQQDLLENNNGRYALLAPAGTPGQSRTIHRYVRPKTIIGPEYNDHDYRGTGLANPTHWLFTQALVANQDGTTTGGTCRVVVKFTMYVKWNERILQAVD